MCGDEGSEFRVCAFVGLGNKNNLRDGIISQNVSVLCFARSRDVVLQTIRCARRQSFLKRPTYKPKGSKVPI